MKMTVQKNKIIGQINDKTLIEIEDNDNPLLNGGSGLVVENGTLVTDQVMLS